MIKHVVFDWDGTLVDTIPFLQKTFRETFRFLQMPPVPYSEIRKKLQQNPECNIFRLIFGEERAFSASRFFYAYTRRCHLDQLEQIPFAEQILEFCRTSGIKCYIFSTKKLSVLLREINFLGWNQYFCRISGSQESSLAKPNPQACRIFWQEQMPPAAEVLMFGDGPADTQTARVWGCRSVILDRNDCYQGEAPDYRLKSLKEFIPLLQSMLY